MTRRRQRLIWISPGATTRTAERVAAVLADRAEVAAKGLEVWTQPADAAYDLNIEVDAVWKVASDRGWAQFHVFGVSAGATVALAWTLVQPERVRTLALLEPATIGEDAWSTVEVDFRQAMASVRETPVAERHASFRRLMMRPDAPAPSSDPGLLWDARSDALEDALEHPGFTSGDLARLRQPTFAISGGRSHPRFASVAERLAAVMPRAEVVTVPELSHLNVYDQSPRLAELVTDLFVRAAG